MIWARAFGSTISPAICWISGTLRHYIDELSVTGLTSNPTIFDHAISNSATYDAADPPRGAGTAVSARTCFSIWRWRI